MCRDDCEKWWWYRALVAWPNARAPGWNLLKRRLELLQGRAPEVAGVVPSERESRKGERENLVHAQQSQARSD